MSEKDTFGLVTKEGCDSASDSAASEVNSAELPRVLWSRTSVRMIHKCPQHIFTLIRPDWQQISQEKVEFGQQRAGCFHPPVHHQ